jgi:hypothetical protein
MSDPGSSVVRFFGAILMAVGGLVAVLSGGCTAVFVGLGLIEIATSKSRGEDLGLLFSFLFVGAAPFAVGALLFFAGRAMRRAGR